eukprot:5637591-Prymnesium_polylepis.1
MPHADAVDAFVWQLAEVLPGNPGLDALQRALLYAEVFDWASQPYVRGGYSAPSARELPGARSMYRRPEAGGRLVFAGEATEDAMMTMNAALDSGARAARELVQGPLREALAAVSGTDDDASLKVSEPGGPRARL